MRYTKEDKLRWVESYKKGLYIDTPEGVARHTFLHKVNDWAKMCDLYGPDVLGHRPSNRAYTAEDRMAAVARVLAGESMGAVSKSIGMTQAGCLAHWCRAYSEKGMAGLESMRKGRPPTMPKKKRKITEGEGGELAALRARNEYLETENAYLKKIDALVTGREPGRPKAKGPRRSLGSGGEAKG